MTTLRSESVDSQEFWQKRKKVPSGPTWIRLFMAYCVLLMIVPLDGQSQNAMPRLVRSGDKFELLVDGAPYLILGGQAHNSSASSMKDADRVYEAINSIHGNTAEMPLSWNLLESERGKYEFGLVDELIAHARNHDLHLIFLWFGTTKNATLSYAPDWVKKDTKTYFRARDIAGNEMYAVSPFCTAAQEADSTAFAHLMRHIREIDGAQHTVIMVQVENETGLIRTDRDHSSAADQAFSGQVSPEILRYLSLHKASLRPALIEAWQGQGMRTAGTWTEVFGDAAPEVFSAWAFGHFTNAIASAGKAEYPLPYYVNVALMNTGAARPGEWPTGGAAGNVIDIWKAVAPDIDLIAPDIYRNDFPEIADIYDRSDNPLFVPETGFAPYYAPYVYTALAGHNGIGFSPFGVDESSQELSDGYNEAPALHRETAGTAALASMEENYRVLRPLLPLIATMRYQNRLFPIVLNFYRHDSVAIPVGDSLAAVVHFDEAFVANTAAHRAGGILIKLTPETFIIAGHGFHVDFEELKGAPRNAEFLSIEEGTFVNGSWVSDRVLNGDEESVRLLKGKSRILKVRLNRK